MPNFQYSRYSDNLLAGITPTLVSGTVLTDYPLANATDLTPGTYVWFTGATMRIAWNLGTPKLPNWFTLINHNLDEGLSGVVFQGNGSNSWGAPAYSATIAIPPKDADRYRGNPWVDLSANVTPYLWWSFAVTVANSSAVQFGECLALANGLRRFAHNINYPVRHADRRRVKVNETPYGVKFVGDFGVRQRVISAEVDTTDDDVRTNLRPWWLDAAGGARPFVIVPDPDINDALMVRFAGDTNEFEQQFIDRNRIGFQFEELSRGLPPA